MPSSEVFGTCCEIQRKRVRNVCVAFMGMCLVLYRSFIAQSSRHGRYLFSETSFTVDRRRKAVFFFEAREVGR